MKKWLALALLIVVALFGYVAAGPYIAIHGIRQALIEQDTARLERYVDFPALRVNLRAQLQDRLAREAGSEVQSSLLGAFGLSVANQLVASGVDAAVTPLGIGALLQGRAMWKKAIGDTINGDTYAAAVPADPLKDAEHHYQSTSRFTASIRGDDGQPIVAVFSRDGLRWKLTNIELPR
ncbi:DUF2939 domain-containing protein [Pseudoxanthomonas dokdonensis]|uniref:DUF2939 domain-containing protein n=1 Tax=Pseudoxanthomonas dokdonensis TaxID=344882 RepID=A0A0R0CZR6_9GAMM|nr:DUF2939 domain-containing protein [Pseudoxanthomonas dokdonensis]KRG70632.1 hypothetical protein ABB29_06125 [Pseudoxanthomonas dokdonensis]